jgi:hypothetical protein
MSTIFRRKLSAKHRLRKQRPSTVVKAAATAAAVETSLINPLNSVADRRSSLTNPSPLEIASAPQPSIKMSESSLFGGRVPLGSNVDDDGHVKSIEPLEVVAPLPAVVEAVGEDEAFAPTRILPTGLGGDNGGANQEQLNSPEGHNYL